MYQKIVVSMALDHGYGERALELARKLKTGDEKIIALHVCEPVDKTISSYVPDDHMQTVINSALEEIVQRIGDSEDVEPVVLSGYSRRTIVEYAKKVKADLIIVGSHKPNLQDFLLGSTASRVVRYSPCDVHVLRDCEN